MQRTCAYGLGFMVDVADHEFGRHVAPESFGASGFAATTCAFVDPRHELVVAWHSIGVLDASRAIYGRREARCEWLYERLGLV